VDVFYSFTGIRSDDCAGLVWACLRGCILALPHLPQTSKCKGFSRWQVKEVGLLAGCLALPFIEPVCWDQASVMFQGRFEGGLGAKGFHPGGIDHLGADRDILGPERHQPPVALLDVAHAFLLDDYRDLLGGSDVVLG
jgi:hypothetical protein